MAARSPWYRQVVKDYPATYDEINKLATGEAAKVANLPLEQMQGNDALQSVVLAARSRCNRCRSSSKRCGIMSSGLPKQKLPDWRGATSAIDSGMTALTELLGPVIISFDKEKSDLKLPEAVRQYMTDSLPRLSAD